MPSELETLLTLRRQAERAAEARFALAAAEHERQQRAQAELVHRCLTAQRAAEVERAGPPRAPATAGAALAGERYRRELDRSAARAAERARAHREGGLAAARQTEQQAREAYERARGERETAEQVAERAHAAAAKVQARRTAASVDDLASAAYVRRKREQG